MDPLTILLWLAVAVVVLVLAGYVVSIVVAVIAARRIRRTADTFHRELRGTSLLSARERLENLQRHQPYDTRQRPRS